MSRTAMGMSRSISIAAVFLSAAVAWAQWEPEPSLNTGRAYHAAAVDPCGNIYVIGGHFWDPYDVDTVEKLAFDGSVYATEWTYVSPMPSPRNSHAAASVGGFIYVIGGADGGQYLASVVRYDVTTDTWDSVAVPDLNVARVSPGATVDKWGRIWVVGGFADGNPLDSVEVYDPARPELGWVLGAVLQQARGLPGVVTDRRGWIYAIGGQGANGSHLTSVERLNPCDKQGAWVFVSDIVGPNSNMDAAVLGADGRIYVAGGWVNNWQTNRVVRYDVESDTWEEWFSLAQARSVLAVVLGANGRIFAIGGAVYPHPPTPQTTVESLDTTFQCPEPPEPPVPTVSEWGMIVMSLLVLTAGTLVFRARRTATG